MDAMIAKAINNSRLSSSCINEATHDLSLTTKRFAFRGLGSKHDGFFVRHTSNAIATREGRH